jgi:fatty-acyl-CoA synthase
MLICTRRVSKLANLLTGTLRVKPGETVGIIDYDSHRFLEGYFAIPMIGAILHTINFRHSEEEIVHAINHAEDKIIFCNKDFIPLLDKLQDRIQGVKKIVILSDDENEIITSFKLEGEYENMLTQQKDEYEFPDFDENSVATIFFTTGTTGLPKAVHFSHRQLILHTMALTTTLAGIDASASINSEDVYMPFTPMFHVHAWGMPYLATYLGMKQVYPGKYEPGVLLQLKREEKVTVSHGVPTLLQMMLNHPDVNKTDLTGWKITVGGSALPKGLATRLVARGINLNVGYGMSETGPVISISYVEKQTIATLSNDEQLEMRLKAGLPIHFSEVKLKNAAGDFVTNDGISRGEVVVRSPWAVKSYYDDPARS